MSHPTERRPPAADHQRLPPAEVADILATEEAWADLAGRLAPFDALVPHTAPPWRAAALGVVTLVGVVAASLVALVAVMSVERWLIPDGEAADLGHGVALGVFVLVWGLLSLGLLAVAARLTLGRAATLARGDLAAAGLVLLLQAGWTFALHAWLVGVAGYVELDLVRPGTSLWPAIVVLATLALAAVRLSRSRIALGLLGFAGLAAAVLFVETFQNGLGAIADGDVSGPGLAVGILSVAQLAVLGRWWWVTARRRLVGLIR